MERRGAYREGVNDMQSLFESVEVQVHGPSDDPMKGKCGAHVWLCDLDDARTYEGSGATDQESDRAPPVYRAIDFREGCARQTPRCSAGISRIRNGAEGETPFAAPIRRKELAGVRFRV